MKNNNVIHIDFKNKKFELPKKVLSRFLSFVENRFEVKAHYVSFKNNNPSSFKQMHKKTLKNLLEKNNPLFLLGEICFPIYEWRDITGCVRVLNIDHLSSKKRAELVDFLSWLSEEHGDSSEKLKNLQCLERKFFTEHLNYEQGRAIFAPDKKKDQGYKNKIPFFQDQKESLFESPVLIQSPSSAEDIYKMALEIHYFSKRPAFCNIDQIIGDDKIVDQETLMCLGPMTLFIQEITHFPFTSQQQLADFLEQASLSGRSDRCPHLIFGASYEFQDKWPFLSVPLLKQLKTVQMLDDFDSYKEKGLLNFLSKVLESAN